MISNRRIKRIIIFFIILGGITVIILINDAISIPPISMTTTNMAGMYQNIINTSQRYRDTDNYLYAIDDKCHQKDAWGEYISIYIVDDEVVLWSNGSDTMRDASNDSDDVVMMFCLSMDNNVNIYTYVSEFKESHPFLFMSITNTFEKEGHSDP